MGLFVVGIIFVNPFVRPHLGSSRKIHQGQKIHISLVPAAGSTTENYFPKARPFDDNPSFWQMLSGEEKELNVNISKWLEVDLSPETRDG